MPSVAHTSIFFVENNASTGQNASTPTSLIRAASGGLSTNYWVVVGRHLQTSMPRTSIVISMINLPGFVLTGADPPSFSHCPTGCVFNVFALTTPAEITEFVHSLPNKQCQCDPLPTWLSKANVAILSPFLRHFFNSCLEHGSVPSSFKSGYITPLLKKADLYATDVKSYRPITNLSVVSKVLERLVARQLVRYLTENSLLPRLQSAYRAHHSTETALLKVIGDILLALDSGNLPMLSLLDLSATFDTVDHYSLLQRLRTSYGLCGIVFKWFMSYLTGCTQFVRTSATASLPLPVVHGVPQGSVRSFSCCTSPISCS